MQYSFGYAVATTPNTTAGVFAVPSITATVETTGTTSATYAASATTVATGTDESGYQNDRCNDQPHFGMVVFFAGLNGVLAIWSNAFHFPRPFYMCFVYRERWDLKRYIYAVSPMHHYRSISP